ncbi:hypothetical protein ACFW7J_06735 [Streptomyces sp. NPDC059525]|uniref:hypothetical protein n=1 Tax=Streptomyces sp. NPDC059525 TaxID=3346857 RepID=UPI0036A1EB44
MLEHVHVYADSCRRVGRLVGTYEGLNGAKPVSERKALLNTLPAGGVEAWSATDGKRLWSVPDTFAPRVFGGDTVVMVKSAPEEKSSGTLAVDIRTGTQRWLYRDLFSPSPGNVPAVVGERAR